MTYLRKHKLNPDSLFLFWCFVYCLQNVCVCVCVHFEYTHSPTWLGKIYYQQKVVPYRKRKNRAQEGISSVQKVRTLKNILFIYLAGLSLCCCECAFSPCGGAGLLYSCHAQASHCSRFSCYESWTPGSKFSSCRTWAQQMQRMGLVAPGVWNFPGPGIKPVSSESAG